MKSQKQSILEHLQKGKSISPYESLTKFGCFRLAARVNDLKNEGHKIETTMIHTGQNTKYAKYKLIQSS